MKCSNLSTILILVSSVYILESCSIMASSKLSSSTSIQIKLPENLKGANGYSLCLERNNRSENSCTPGFLVENNVAQIGINTDIQNACPSGYKLKLWLWSSNSSGKTNLYSIDRISSNFVLENGFVLIPQSTLTGSLKLEIHLDNINQSSFDTSCKVDLLPSNNTNNSEVKTSSSPAPTGELVETRSQPTILKGYPSMVIYSASWCGPCQTLKGQIKTSKKSMFQGKMYVYDVEDGATSPHGVSAYPTIDFYNKDATFAGQIVGGDWNKINAYFNKLTQ